MPERGEYRPREAQEMTERGVDSGNDEIGKKEADKGLEKEKKNIWRFLKEQFEKHPLMAGNSGEKREIMIDEALMDKYQKFLFESEDGNDEQLKKRQDRYWLVLKSHLIIKEEDIPEEYYQGQVEMARREGIEVEITQEMKEQLAKTLVKDQEVSLEYWYRYLLANEDNHYPMWFNYYVFRGAEKLGQYDKKERKFKRRRKNTVAPFADLNREAVALIYDFLHAQVQKKEGAKINKIEDNSQVFESIKSFNFGELYAKTLTSLEQKKQARVERDNYQGEWVKYDQHSDPRILVGAIEEYSTGWCTKGIKTATTQLSLGDFYIYHVNDEHGQAKTPMIAIRMENGRVREVRGVEENQNLTDGKLLAIADEKLATLPGGKDYGPTMEKMRQLSSIEDKMAQGEELSEEEILFLWASGEIKGFGYTKDKRVDELRVQRNMVDDLNPIFDKHMILERDLNLDGLQSAEGLVLPKEIGGGLSFWGLKSAEGLVLPKEIGGNLSLYSLKSAEGLVLPEKIGGDLSLSCLQSAEGLVLPKEIGGDLILESLETFKGLVLPEKIGGNLFLCEWLQSVEGLVLPKEIGGGLHLGDLKSAEGLVLPEKIGGDLNLGDLKSAEGLVLPEKIGGDLSLYSLKSAEGLVLPKEIGGDLNLGDLESAEGLVLPEKIGGGLSFWGLKSAEGLVLPKEIGGNLSLYSLKSAEGLVLPEKIGGDLSLRGLESAEGLVWPKANKAGLRLFLSRQIKLTDEQRGEIESKGWIIEYS